LIFLIFRRDVDYSHLSSIGTSEKRSFCHSREDGNPEFNSKNIFKKCTFISLSELPIGDFDNIYQYLGPADFLQLILPLDKGR